MCSWARLQATTGFGGRTVWAQSGRKHGFPYRLTPEWIGRTRSAAPVPHIRRKSRQLVIVRGPIGLIHPDKAALSATKTGDELDQVGLPIRAAFGGVSMTEP
jgi:hypothetical protein